MQAAAESARVGAAEADGGPLPARNQVKIALGRRGGRMRLVGVVTGTVAVAVLLVVMLVPFPRSFSATVSTAHVGVGPGNVAYFGFTTQDFPKGSSVSVDWQSGTGDAVYVTVFTYSSEATQNCTATGTSGHCSLVSVGGSYTLAVQDVGANETIETVTFDGTYTATYL